ncbi:MAG: periplasmic heavy metal sensor [Rhodospirillaceae bacterium]|nr:periplasmic heavy metal sensor [Rhodospirillaceae bacterium]
MTATTRMGATVVILTMVAVAAGVWIGMGIGARHLHHASSLDEILHHELNLTAEQKKHISALEANFVLDRQDSEMQMRAANLELARALEAEHGYGDGQRRRFRISTMLWPSCKSKPSAMSSICARFSRPSRQTGSTRLSARPCRRTLPNGKERAV